MTGFWRMQDAVGAFLQKFEVPRGDRAVALAHVAKLTEEVGELAGAVNKGQRDKQGKEAADVLLALLGLMYLLDIDLEGLFWAKHALIMQRPGKFDGTMIVFDEAAKAREPGTA